MKKLSELNDAGEELAMMLVAPLIERSPEVAKRVVERRPFRDPDHLRDTIRKELLKLNEEERIRLFRAHPELAPENPLAMTGESQSEQGRLNLTSEHNRYRMRLDELNAAYREKFGFPFITALVRHANIESVLAEFERRLSADKGSEVERAIEQIVVVCSSRIEASFGGEDSGPLMNASTKT